MPAGGDVGQQGGRLVQRDDVGDQVLTWLAHELQAALPGWLIARWRANFIAVSPDTGLAATAAALDEVVQHIRVVSKKHPELPDYVNRRKAGVFADDPFQSLDQEGVGRLVGLAVAAGRSVNPKLKLGVCGEHGGEAKSVKFFHKVGLDYVSCSPFRVPIARLAAAQAALTEKTGKSGPSTA